MPRIGALGTDPIDHARDLIGPRFDTAVVFFKGGCAGNLARRRGLEIAFDLSMQGRLVILDGKQIVAVGIADGLGGAGIAARGVDGHQRAGHVEAFEQHRNGGNYAGSKESCFDLAALSIMGFRGNIGSQAR